MVRGLFRQLLFCLSAALGLAAAQPGWAESFAPGSTCHAASDSAAPPARWNCSREGWSIAQRHAFLRFDLRGVEYAPIVFETRLTRFAAMRITVIGTQGRSASRELTEADLIPASYDWKMAAALPRIYGPVEAVIVRIDEARHLGVLSDARLAPMSDGAGSLSRGELLIAALCGMLCLPLLFNLAFFRVLREPFLLWHALSTALMLAHTLVTSGLVNRFASLDLGTLSATSAITVGGAIVGASFFAADLIEADKLDARHRRWLRLAALWIAPWTLFYILAGGPLRAWSAPAYLASFLPVLALLVWTMAVAKLRGSRAVNYQIAAWMPVMATTLGRIVTSLGVSAAPHELLVAQHYAMGFEVIITSLGVIDRLMTIRRERDLALAEIRIFEDQVERDPLTGLYNRRAIEQRFARMHAAGFRTMAVIDLDKFKLVNDTFGHLTGDTVLRVAAEALEPDADTLAVRMGGEEFMLLLRGRDTVLRAERRRQAISTRIAAKVPGLDRVITASMGLVELPADGRIGHDFATLYGHCDRLLYDAKDAGRNRTMREKLQSFEIKRPRAA
jgi:diguanylate cyclase (GGDEF)-like protein